MGDVEEGIDPSLLAEGLPHVDLLKVAHHGSKTATTEPFIEATRPKVAVASAGAGNPYGHPAKATLDRLAAAGARVLRTDRDGTVVVGFEAGQMTVRTEGVATADIATDAERTARAAVPASALGLLGQAAPRPDPDRGLAFLCAIPVTGLVPDSRPGTAAAPVPDWSDGGSTPHPGRAGVVGYHRDDDGARAGGGRLPAALPRSPTLAAAPRARRGRGRGLAGGSDRGARRRSSIASWSSRRRCSTISTRRSRRTTLRTTSAMVTARRPGSPVPVIRSWPGRWRRIR